MGIADVYLIHRAFLISILQYSRERLEYSLLEISIQ